MLFKFHQSWGMDLLKSLIQPKSQEPLICVCCCSFPYNMRQREKFLTAEFPRLCFWQNMYRKREAEVLQLSFIGSIFRQTFVWTSSSFWCHECSCQCWVCSSGKEGPQKCISKSQFFRVFFEETHFHSRPSSFFIGEINFCSQPSDLILRSW